MRPAFDKRGGRTLPPGPPSPPFGPPLARYARGPALLAFVLGLASRLVLLAAWGSNYSFDGFQRWAGRDHVLVQAWLPVTQSVIWAVSALGGGLVAARIAMAVIAAGAGAAGTVLAERLGGRAAGWAFLVPACYGPFLVWGSALYQEGTFLLVLFSGLALALSPGRMLAADLVIGLLGLVRYEGWPCVVVYMLWRRDPRAFVAAWGMAVWLVIRMGLGLHGYAASPVDFNDWVGLEERWNLASWLHDASRLFDSAWGSGGVAIGVAGLVGWAFGWRSRGAILVMVITAGQVAAVSGWLVGLEVATTRMLVVPVMLFGVMAAAGAGLLWGRLPEALRPAVVGGSALLMSIGHADAWRSTRAELVRNGPERALLDEIEGEPACMLVVTPRSRLGTRNRHDGCEVIQGLTDLRQGEGLWCVPWAGPYAGPGCVRTAVWDKDQDRYVVSEVVPPTAAGP